MQDFLSLDDIERRKDELKSERAELGNPHARELKDFEKPLNYILETEDSFFDPLHALELFGRADNTLEEVDEITRDAYGGRLGPIDEALEGTTFTWEQELQDGSNPLYPYDEPSSHIFDKMNKGFLIYEVSNLSEESVLSEEFEEWFDRLLERGRTIAQIDGAVNSYKLGGFDPEKFLEETKILQEYRKLESEKLGFSLPTSKINSERQESMFSSDHMKNPEKYQGAQVEIPKPNPQLKYTLADKLLEEYEKRIEQVKPEEEETEERELVEKEITRTDTRTVVDWDKLAAEPSEELKQLYEAGAKYQQESEIELDAQRLGKIVADMNGEDVEYDDGVKLGPLGDVKKAIDKIDNLDYSLPVSSKLQELSTIAEFIDYTEEIRGREEFEYTDTVKVKE